MCLELAICVGEGEVEGNQKSVSHRKFQSVEFLSTLSLVFVAIGGKCYANVGYGVVGRYHRSPSADCLLLVWIFYCQIVGADGMHGQ